MSRGPQKGGMITDAAMLTGPEKAAIVLLTLGEEGTAIWQMLDEEEIKVVVVVVRMLEVEVEDGFWFSLSVAFEARDIFSRPFFLLTSSWSFFSRLAGLF